MGKLVEDTNFSMPTTCAVCRTPFDRTVTPHIIYRAGFACEECADDEGATEADYAEAKALVQAGGVRGGKLL